MHKGLGKGYLILQGSGTPGGSDKGCYSVHNRGKPGLMEFVVISASGYNPRTIQREHKYCVRTPFMYRCSGTTSGSHREWVDLGHSVVFPYINPVTNTGEYNVYSYVFSYTATYALQPNIKILKYPWFHTVFISLQKRLKKIHQIFSKCKSV